MLLYFDYDANDDDDDDNEGDFLSSFFLKLIYIIVYLMYISSCVLEDNVHNNCLTCLICWLNCGLVRSKSKSPYVRDFNKIVYKGVDL